MQVKLKLSKEEIIDAVSNDEMVQMDGLKYVEKNGITTVTGSVCAIANTLVELSNIYEDIDELAL